MDNEKVNLLLDKMELNRIDKIHKKEIKKMQKVFELENIIEEHLSKNTTNVVILDKNKYSKEIVKNACSFNYIFIEDVYKFYEISNRYILVDYLFIKPTFKQYLFCYLRNFRITISILLFIIALCFVNYGIINIKLYAFLLGILCIIFLFIIVMFVDDDLIDRCSYDG